MFAQAHLKLDPTKERVTYGFVMDERAPFQFLEGGQCGHTSALGTGASAPDTGPLARENRERLLAEGARNVQIRQVQPLTVTAAH